MTPMSVIHVVLFLVNFETGSALASQVKQNKLKELFDYVSNIKIYL